MSYSKVKEKLAAGEPVILDGGIGTEVLKRTGLWVRNGIETAGDTIREIHRDYIAAGADVIRANTFQVARHTFVNFFHGLEHMRAIGRPGLENRAAELQRMAVEHAQAARREAGAEGRVAVAGSISPLNHPYRSDQAPDSAQAEEEHAETARTLAAAGADLILLETMNTLSEARAAVKAAASTGLPVWVSLVPDGHGRTLGGDPLRGAAGELGELGAAAVLANCAPTDHIATAVAAMGGHGGLPLGAFALIGRYAPPSWKMDFFPRFIGWEETSPEAYAAAAGGWSDAGARILGGCCGTTPAHIQALAAAHRN